MLKPVKSVPPGTYARTSITRRVIVVLEGAARDGGVPVEFPDEGAVRFLHPEVLVEVP